MKTYFKTAKTGINDKLDAKFLDIYCEYAMIKNTALEKQFKKQTHKHDYKKMESMVNAYIESIIDNSFMRPCNNVIVMIEKKN